MCLPYLLYQYIAMFGHVLSIQSVDVIYDESCVFPNVRDQSNVSRTVSEKYVNTAPALGFAGPWTNHIGK